MFIFNLEFIKLLLKSRANTRIVYLKDDSRALCVRASTILNHSIVTNITFRLNHQIK